MQLEVAKVFAPVFQWKHRFVMLSTGRLGGKTHVASQIVFVLSMSHPKRDVIFCRDAYSDLEKTSYQNIKNFIISQGLESSFDFKREPLRIYNKITEGTIYFEGIGGSDTSRTRSFTPTHPLIAIIYDELQESRTQESIEQANASFRRFLDTSMGVVVHMFNPPSANSHWINTYWNLKRQDPDWLCIKSDYRDIAKFLSDLDLKEVLKMKYDDPDRYNYLYLGQSGGGFGAVYPQFRREKHFIPYMKVIEEFGFTGGSPMNEEAKCLRFGQRIHAVIIGGDGAVTHDATSFNVNFLMQDGRQVVGEPFHYDPKKSGQRSSYELMPYILKWLNYIDQRYQILAQNIPIIFSVDSASTELIRMIRFHLDDRYQVYSYGKQTVLDMVGVVQTVLAKNMVIVMDFGGIMDWVTGRFVKGEHPLVVALENLIWNEKQTGFDPIVPNDASDSETYAINFTFRNPHNLYPIQIYNSNRQDFYK